MATSRTTISPENITECGICHRQFVDPRLLPCSHTYCLRCIRQNAANHNHHQFECPRLDGTKVSENFIATLPVNQTMSDVIDFLASLSGSIHCSNCCSTKSEYWCDNCRTNYCATCSNTVHTMRAFRDHRQIPLREKPVELNSCEKHTDEKLKYWCRKCNTFVCSDCLLSEHEDHPYVVLHKVAKELETKVKTDLVNIKSSLNDKVNRTENLSTEISEDHQSNRKMITDSMEHLQTIVTKHERELLEKIDRIETNENRRMADFKTELQNELHGLYVQQKTLEILLSSRDQTKLLRAQQGFLLYINRINRSLDGLRIPAKHEYRVEGIDLLQNIRENILQCGRLMENVRKTADSATYRNPQLEKLMADHQTKQEWDLGGRILTDQDMGIIADGLQNNTSLTKLDLSDSQIDDQGTEYLAVALKQNRTLLTLHLNKNQIGDYGVQHLADALLQNKTLTTLDLYQNQISYRGIQHLANMLRQNETLVTLFLSGNPIADQGAQLLADALEENNTLSILHLAQTQIGDLGAQHFADALRHNGKLTVLNLYSNDISDHGAQALANALQHNGTLTTLYLANNRIGNDGALQLADGLKQNRALTKLTLNQNPIAQQAQVQAQRILKANKHLMVNW